LSRVVLRIIQLMYFMAPAYVANMVPPFLKYWKGWNPPISRRWLGSHKTVLGFTAGVLGGVLTAGIQSHLGWWSDAIAVRETWLGLGLRFGIGAMAGDAVKSFFKRRAGRAVGRAVGPVRSDRLHRRGARARLAGRGSLMAGCGDDPARERARPHPRQPHRLLARVRPARW
jgi:hypothetical protein